jgi:hypothetical protein
VLVAFFVVAWGIWTQASWWPWLLGGSGVVSLVVLLAMWNPVRNVSFNALVANLVLAAAMFMPWGTRFLGAH